MLSFLENDDWEVEAARLNSCGFCAYFTIFCANRRHRGGPADQQQQRPGVVGYAGFDEYPVGVVMKKARM